MGSRPEEVKGSSIDTLSYPVVAFRDSYIFVARKPDDLRVWHRGEFRRTAGESWFFADSTGSVFRATSWCKARVPRSWTGLGSLLLGSLFVEPTLAFERSVTPMDLAEQIGRIIITYGKYGSSYGDDVQGLRDDLSKVKSFDDLFRTLPRFP